MSLLENVMIKQLEIQEPLQGSTLINWFICSPNRILAIGLTVCKALTGVWMIPLFMSLQKGLFQ